MPSLWNAFAVLTADKAVSSALGDAFAKFRFVGGNPGASLTGAGRNRIRLSDNFPSQPMWAPGYFDDLVLASRLFQRFVPQRQRRLKRQRRRHLSRCHRGGGRRGARGSSPFWHCVEDGRFAFSYRRLNRLRLLDSRRRRHAVWIHQPANTYASRCQRAGRDHGIADQAPGNRHVEKTRPIPRTFRGPVALIRPTSLSSVPRGRSSVVERQLPKLNVVGSIPIARSSCSGAL